MNGCNRKPALEVSVDVKHPSEEKTMKKKKRKQSDVND